MVVPLLPAVAAGVGGLSAGAAGAGAAGAGITGGGLLTALSALQAPPAPDLIPPPSAIRPGLGGPGPSPALLATILQLLQTASGQAQGIPTLGQLIAGGGSATAGPTLSL